MTKALAIKKQLTVAAPIDRAFRVFTAAMGSWWPKQHHIGKAELADCVIEPKVGGRWFERGTDGSECDWGKVLAWEPPRRVVLAWQLNAQFQFDPELISEVEVRFIELGPAQTQVELEHRNLERISPTADRLFEEMDGGWAMILDGFAKSAAG